MTRASVAQDIAANIVHQHEHQQQVKALPCSGYKCLVCGSFVRILTNGHARKCGFINREAMIVNGAVRQYIWGKEIKVYE